MILTGQQFQYAIHKAKTPVVSVNIAEENNKDESFCLTAHYSG